MDSRALKAERAFGPGLLAAASNNDPTTVATLAVVGATTGYALCWLVILIIPMVALVQALAADIGAVCQTSLSGAIRRHYGFGWALVVLVALGAVNTLTLAADVKAGSEALALLTHIDARAYIIPIVAVVAWLLLSHSYHRIERALLAVSVVFVLYVVSAILAHVDVAALLRDGLVPRSSVSPAYLAGAVALLGTTLTGYAYVWESIGVAERGAGKRRAGRASIRAFERDAAAGMAVVGMLFLAILIASAATLGRNHLIVATASDMALALRPLAGPWAGALFGIGLLASAILAVPVLASVNAYVAAHTFGWPGSLDATLRDAPAFYVVASASLALAAVIAFAPVSSIALLSWSSIAGGVATPVSLTFLMLVAGNHTAMGSNRMSRAWAVCGWGITAIVTLAVVAFLVSTFGG